MVWVDGWNRLSKQISSVDSIKNIITILGKVMKRGTYIDKPHLHYSHMFTQELVVANSVIFLIQR